MILQVLKNIYLITWILEILLWNIEGVIIAKSL